MAKNDAARIWRLNFQLSTDVLIEATPAFAMLELEAKEFFVLDGIEDRPYPAALAQHLSMPKPTMTLYLKTLQKKGFIARGIDPDDLRRHRLELTPSGRRTVERARTALSTRYGERLARLGRGEQAEFARLLEKLTG